MLIKRIAWTNHSLVSDDGRIWSDYRGKLVVRPLFAGEGGYLITSFRRASGQKTITRKVHTLVAEAFLPPRPPGMLCCHRDDDKTNNAAKNLYWGTPKDNGADYVRNGKSPKGERNVKAKLTMDDVIAIRGRYALEEPIASIARDFKVGRTQVSNIVHRNNWAHV